MKNGTKESNYENGMKESDHENRTQESDYEKRNGRVRPCLNGMGESSYEQTNQGNAEMNIVDEMILSLG